MRFVDLSVAGLIAISGIIALLALNPGGADVAAQRNVDEAHLRDFLTRIVVGVGLVELMREPPSVLCAYVGSLSNSTLTVAAMVDGVPCGGVPPAGAASAEVAVAVGQRTVVLEDWYGARQ